MDKPEPSGSFLACTLVARLSLVEPGRFRPEAGLCTKAEQRHDGDSWFSALFFQT